MPTQVIWTRELIRRFWDGLAEMPVNEKLSFARLAGPMVVALARPHMPKDAHCLDYGGGNGHLAEALISAGYSSASFEPSPARAACIEERLRGHEGFIGNIGAESEARFDVLFCLEVIEHIPEADMAGFLRDLNDRLVDRGTIFLTCPNDEDLETSQVFCPICESTFHRWQHLRSLKASTVRGLLEAAGFETVFLGLVGFGSPDAIEEFLARDDGAPWPNNVIDGSGRAIPVVGSSDRIVYVGRKLRPAGDFAVGRILHSATTPSAVPQLQADELTIAATLERARSAPKPAVVVVPTETVADMPADVRLVVAPHAFASEDDTTRDPDGADLKDGLAFGDAKALIYPGSLASYRRARRRGVLPDSREIHLFERGNWRIVHRYVPKAETTASEAAARPASVGTSTVARAARLGETMWPGYERHLRRPLQQLTQYRTARSLQRYVDRRERDLGTLLRHPTGFPYRLSQVVERRVVLAISSLYNGGAERQTVYTAAGLREHGLDDVHILAEYLHNNKANAFYLAAARGAAATVEELSDAENPHKAWARQNSALFGILHDNLSNRVLNAAAYLQRVAPEIVQVSLDWTNVTIGLAAALAGVPHIFLSGRNLSPIHFGFFNWFLYPAYRALAQQPNVQLLNNSAAGASDYARWLRIPNDQIGVLRNGFDPRRFPPVSEERRREARARYRIPPDSRVVVGAFRLSDEKRPLMWVEVAACILRQEPNAFFVLLGDGPLRYRTKQLAWSLGIGERIIFPGVKGVAFAFAAADIVMLASLKEGTPNVLIEAQAMGIPVVATAAYGSAETVDNGVTGHVVRNETAEEIAAVALSVLRDEGFRARAAEAGPAFVERRFGMQHMVDNTLRIYAAAGVSWAAPTAPSAADLES